MLCQLAVLNVRNSRLMVKDNVGSDCYWYAQKRTGVCIEGIYISSAHFFPDTCYILAQAETPLVHHQGQFSRPSTSDELKWKPAPFYVLW